MVGIVLCAFFVLGVMTGFSPPGRALTARAANLISVCAVRIERAAVPAAPALEWLRTAVESIERKLGIHSSSATARIADAARGGAIAMVERRDGFYALFADGELQGPVSPNAEGDLPILSGARARDSRGADLVGYAATMVRAEAQLSHLVSEMRVNGDGVASLYLDRTRTEIVIDQADAPAEIRRADEVLAKWQGRERMVAAIDMTTPGEAIVRLAPPEPPHRHGVLRRVSVRVGPGHTGASNAARGKR